MSHDVDEVGNATLVAAAEAAGVRRFVFVSVGAQQLAAHTPFTDAKRATEARIRSAAFESVIIRPDAFQEVWLSPVVGFDPVHATARIFGKRTGRTRFVGVDDVAEAIARIAVADTAPGEVILGGPEALSTVEAADAFGRISGRPMKVSHVPRFALTVGSKALRSFRPVMASLMGMALETDGVDSDLDDSGFRALGITPRPVVGVPADPGRAGRRLTRRRRPPRRAPDDGRSAPADRHELGRAADADLPEPRPQGLAARLEVRVSFGEHNVPVDRRLQLGRRLRIVGVFVRVGQVDDPQVGEPEALDNLHDPRPFVGLPVNLAVEPVHGRPPVVQEHVRGLGLGLAVAVHLVDDEVAAGAKDAQHLGQHGGRVREVVEGV